MRGNQLSVIMLSVVMLSVFILSVIMLSVVMLSVIMMNVILLNVVVQYRPISSLAHPISLGEIDTNYRRGLPTGYRNGVLQL
jgi:hypothetical protein